LIFSKDKDGKFILIKIYKSYLNNFDIYDKNQVIDLFKNIFIKVKKKYNLSGLFDANIYVNDDYGMIIEIYNLYFYDIESDIKIKVYLDSIFLSEIFNYEIIDYDEVYYYNDKFYGKYKEFSDKGVIYKNVDEIMNNGIKLY